MKRFLGVILVLAMLLGIFAVGVSAASSNPPNWLNNEEHTTWQKFLIGLHRFVVHFLFGWVWMPWFNMLWYGGM